MKETGKIWMNGKMVPFGSAKVHVLTHALHYASAVFEGIRCHKITNGMAIFRLEDHVDRLYKSAKMYSMTIPYTKSQITDAIIKTVKASSIGECYIRPLVYRGYGWMGMGSTKNSIDVAIACWKWQDESTKSAKGIRCKVSSWTRIGSSSQPMKAKAAANYGNSALARIDAIEDGYDEAVMLGPDGNIAEGGATNIFAVKDGQIITPPLSSGILDGITRDSVVQIVEEGGGYVAEHALSREDLYVADEVFLTGTASGIKPVTSVDRVRIGSGKIGSVTRTLYGAYADIVKGRDSRFSEWLTQV